jgi:hypothetical protein
MVVMINLLPFYIPFASLIILEIVIVLSSSVK